MLFSWLWLQLYCIEIVFLILSIEFKNIFNLNTIFLQQIILIIINFDKKNLQVLIILKLYCIAIVFIFLNIELKNIFNLNTNFLATNSIDYMQLWYEKLASIDYIEIRLHWLHYIEVVFLILDIELKNIFNLNMDFLVTKSINYIQLR